MDVGDEDAPDALERDAQLVELFLEDAARLIRLQPGVDQGEAISITNQVDIDVSQLEWHGKLEPVDSVRDLHGANVS
jgi:hypothetical protein